MPSSEPQVTAATIGSQLKTIQGALSDFASEDGGVAYIARDLRHMWQVAMQRTNTLSVIVAYNGEDARVNYEGGQVTGRVDRHFIVLLTRGRGMQQDRSLDLTDQVGNARPLYDLVDQATDIVRALVFDPYWVERTIYFNRVQPVQLSEAIMDAYQVEFSIGSQRLPILSTPPQPAQSPGPQ
jgi:hypothetical protein